MNFILIYSDVLSQRSDFTSSTRLHSTKASKSGIYAHMHPTSLSTLKRVVDTGMTRLKMSLYMNKIDDWPVAPICEHCGPIDIALGAHLSVIKDVGKAQIVRSFFENNASSLLSAWLPSLREQSDFEASPLTSAKMLFSNRLISLDQVQAGFDSFLPRLLKIQPS